MKHPARNLTACVLAAAALECNADNPRTLIDPAGDAKLRLTDWNADGQVNPDATLPDLLSLTLGRWSPTSPATSLYDGSYSDLATAHFLRIDLQLAGCVNPPGSLGLHGDAYDPFLYGNSPVYGHIELDADEDADSGGELGGTASLRYLANVGRFGAMPDASISERVATMGTQIDADFNTFPQFERSGADFTLVLCGCFTPTIVSEGGDSDGLFEPGETWIVSGRFFERFQAFRSASGLFGGSDFGLWDPIVKLRFCHSVASDTTTITLVVPLDQTGAGQMSGAAPQPIDFSVSNQTSVAEAINDLSVQSSSISGPVKVLASKWKGRNPTDYFEIDRWDATAMLATAYLEPESSLYAWTDAAFELLVGDFNGDESADGIDRADLESTILELDGGPSDTDGASNGAVALASFGPNFALHDTDSNGIISVWDWPPGAADVNADTMVDILDLLDYLDAFATCDGGPSPCVVNGVAADFNLDGWIDILDFLDFVEAFGA